MYTYLYDIIIYMLNYPHPRYTHMDQYVQIYTWIHYMQMYTCIHVYIIIYIKIYTYSYVIIMYMYTHLYIYMYTYLSIYIRDMSHSSTCDVVTGGHVKFVTA